jgi:O-sialoglycoprotein endopeptidase
MGFSFPAGRFMDELAISHEGRRIRIPSYADSEKCSFSGTETAALRALNNGVDKTTVAEGVMFAVCEALSKLIYNAALKTGVFDVLITGGVASSKYLRAHLQSILGEQYAGIKVYFTQPRLSSDNAVGTALLARARYTYLTKGE